MVEIDNRRTGVVQVAQKKQIHLYKFTIGIGHIMVYKIVRQQSCICLKFVF